MFIMVCAKRHSSSSKNSPFITTCVLMIILYLILLTGDFQCEAKIKKIKMIKKLIAAKLMLKPLLKSGVIQAPKLHFIMPMGGSLRSLASVTSSSDSSSGGSSSSRTPQEFLQGIFSMQSQSNRPKLQGFLSRLLQKNRVQNSDNKPNCSPVNCNTPCMPTEMMENEIQQQMEEHAKGKNLKGYISIPTGYGSQASESNAEGIMTDTMQENFSWPQEVYGPDTSVNPNSQTPEQYHVPDDRNYQYSPIQNRFQETVNYETKSENQPIDYNQKSHQPEASNRYYESKPNQMTIEY